MLRCHERGTFILFWPSIFARRATTGSRCILAEREFGDSKYSFMRLINLMYDTVTALTATTPLRLLVCWACIAIGTGLAIGIAYCTSHGAGAAVGGGRIYALCRPVCSLNGAIHR